MVKTVSFSMLLCVFQAYGMDSIPSDLLLKSLALTKGYTYVKQLRDDHVDSIYLPKTQFEAACYADQLPLDIKRELKNYLGIGALQWLWAKSYVHYKTLPDSELRYLRSVDINSLAFASDGLLASTACGDVQLWRPHTYQFLTTIGAVPATIDDMVFLPNHLLALGFSYGIHLWDVETQKCVSHLKKPHGVLIIKNKPIMRVGAGLFLSLEQCMERTYLLQWHVQDDRYNLLNIENAEHSNPTSLAVADDGITYAVGMGNGVVELWDLRKHATCCMQYTPDYPVPIDSLVFLTPTLIASAHSDKATCTIYDSTKKEVVKKCGSSCGSIHNLCRVNSTTLVAVTRENYANTTSLEIIDLERGYMLYKDRIPVKIASHYPLAVGPNNTIATGCNKIELFRPRLPSLPDNIDEIPFAAYAFAALEDTYEDNLIDDPDYSEDNI